MSGKVLLRPRLVITLGFFLGHFFSIAYAFEGKLVLPKQVSSSVFFKMDNNPVDINPSEVFQVFAGSRDVCCEGKKAMAGRYTIDEQSVAFIPAFDFIEGQSYTVQMSDRGATNKGNPILSEFTIEQSIVSLSPEIISIFPSGATIPENTLRFYLHFSTPMRPQVSRDFIKLLDATGTPDNEAFMSFKQELWSEDRKRLTLLMDPGRIKRGVAQNLTLGPALEQGSRYTIVVESGWSTATGTTDMPRFEHTFTVSGALRTLPDPALWSITPPAQLTRDPLIIEFDRPFDHELIQHAISVFDRSGKPIPGMISVENQETLWRFDRKGVWGDSPITLVIDAQLEDVAGNNLTELLDHPVGSDVLSPKQRVVILDLESSTN